MLSHRRNPKLFYVSSTTSTLSTTTVCYKSSTTPALAAACGKRKRRAVLADTMDSTDFGLVNSALTKSESTEQR